MILEFKSQAIIIFGLLCRLEISEKKLEMNMAFNVDNLNDELEEKMMHGIEAYQKALSGFRTGKASPALVQDLMVEAYGTQMRLKDMASINTPEPRLISIQPFDASTLADIERALTASNIGITPMNDGRVIRLPMPDLTEERRAEIVKQMNARTEDARIELRNIRREGNEFAKKAQKDSLMTEDDLKLTLDDIQKLTDDYTKQINDSFAAKEKEIMTV